MTYQSSKLLTIGIPTYSGAKTISGVIDRFLRQMQSKNSEFVEIIVSDNASTDLPTSEIG